MLKRLFFICALLTSSLLFATPHVTAVMFYSSRCPHCHQVMKKVLPPLLEQYKSQFEVIFVNISSTLGNELYYEAIDALKVPEEKAGVPTMVIGTRLLVGADEIADDLAILVGEDLKRGGSPLPAIPGLEAAVGAPPEPITKKKPPPITLATEANLKAMAHQTIGEKLTNDPVGNSLAIVMIVILIGSLIWVPIRWKHAGIRHPSKGDPTSYWLPLLAACGVAISIYMTYIETQEMPAVCGPIGNCNAVQQSPYAYIFGIPVGFLGILGYGAIFLFWLIELLKPSFPRWIFPSLLYGAALFSLYLTLLEPFVIGAACVWCLTSALITTAMLWGTVRHGY